MPPRVCSGPRAGCEASLRFVKPPGLPAGLTPIRWTVDSRDIAYVNATEGPNIWIQPLSDHSRAKAATDFTDGWNIRSFAWSRDGRLAVLREKTRTDIVQFKCNRTGAMSACISR
jgi:hypothetical protein